MLKAFTRAIGQLSDPAIRRVLWISLGLSAVVFVGLWIAVGFALSQVSFFDTPWLNQIIDVLGGLATLVLTWLLFPAVVSTTTGLFLDDVATAVEKRYYPALPAPREQPLREVIGASLQLFGIMLLLNVVLLAFLLVPVVFPFVFYGVNGYLIGREYFELVAARWLPPGEIQLLKRRHGREIFVAGIMTAALMTVPFINLLAPLIGTAAMVHIFMKLRFNGRR